MTASSLAVTFGRRRVGGRAVVHEHGARGSGCVEGDLSACEVGGPQISTLNSYTNGRSCAHVLNGTCVA